jgi:Sulfatase-modifying factor enzyme 1
VPTENGPLDDRPVLMGDPDRGLGVTEYIHSSSIAAPFPAPGGGRRYWIGKYPVTRDQFAAMQGTCAPPSFGGRVVKTDVSQIEAIQAAVAWSNWLLANARDTLPKRGGEFAYPRLPTEEEWEFAARGGTRVNAAEFQARTWPMPDGITHYAVAGNAADGRPQQIGVEALANPLGLYGVLGSVDQMMLEPFRLNRVGRLHGEAGGVILRGGNYKNQPDDLHTSMRTEMRPFDPDKHQPTRLPTAGFRLVLSAPTSGDIQEAEAERNSFGALARSHSEALAGNDPHALLGALRKEWTDPTLGRELDQLDASLVSIERAQSDQDRVALRAEIETAAVMAGFIWRLEQTIRIGDKMTNYVKLVAERDAAQEFERARSKTEVVMREEQRASLDGYLRSLRQIAVSRLRDEANREATLVRQEMEDRGQRQLKGFVPVVTRHLAALRGDTLPSLERVKSDILAVPVAPER